MRAFKDMDGVVFDVPDEIIDRFEDIFNHMKSEKRIDYEIDRAKSLPILREDDSNPYQGNSGNSRGGYGGSSYSSYGQNRGGNNRYETRSHDRPSY